MKIYTSLLAFFLAIIFVPPTAYSIGTPPAESICIKKTGTFAIRKGFCKAGEKTASIKNIEANLPSIPVGISRRVHVSALTQPFTGDEIYSSVAQCEADEMLSGGGCESSDNQLLLRDAYPITLSGTQRFHCVYYNSRTTITATLTAHAICLKLG